MISSTFQVQHYFMTVERENTRTERQMSVVLCRVAYYLCLRLGFITEVSLRSWVKVARNFNTITFVCSSVALLYGLWRILEKSKYAEWSKRRIVKHLYFIKVKVARTIYVQQNCFIIYHQFSRIFYLNINFCKQCQEAGVVEYIINTLVLA